MVPGTIKYNDYRNISETPAGSLCEPLLDRLAKRALT